MISLGDARADPGAVVVVYLDTGVAHLTVKHSGRLHNIAGQTVVAINSDIIHWLHQLSWRGGCRLRHVVLYLGGKCIQVTHHLHPILLILLLNSFFWKAIRLLKRCLEYLGIEHIEFVCLICLFMHRVDTKFNRAALKRLGIQFRKQHSILNS